MLGIRCSKDSRSFSRHASSGHFNLPTFTLSLEVGCYSEVDPLRLIGGSLA